MPRLINLWNNLKHLRKHTQFIVAIFTLMSGDIIKFKLLISLAFTSKLSLKFLFSIIIIKKKKLISNSRREIE
ncbi:hypothetical protein BpHYR1_013485 [Brachionus plicatilis]|uniref:Uncharacterized protein n=1 Tax=Brachionus plicatilis TaxID=10195 RepID=A0A3M7PIU1_BRAPC|nr:hypothetical protein BpHYR1_013485 [Brachionus plicatilis]